MAGTLFEATNLPLKCWCLGLYLVAQNKDGLSTLNLGRPLGIAQNSAWLMTHTFMHAMLEAENCQPLGERVELDEAYWGGKRRGGKRGRGAPGKYPFRAAVEPTEEVKWTPKTGQLASAWTKTQNR